MNSEHSKDYSDLDRIRIEEGAEKCRETFGEVLRRSPRQAAALLNDDRLMFTTLYILHLQRPHPRVQRYLSPRNMIAVGIALQIRNPRTKRADALSSGNESVQSALRWILDTGSPEEIQEDFYEEILDVAVSVLLRAYKDADALPPAVGLLFSRNRNERCIHDLVWSLFRFHDPRVLRLIAERIRSANQEDAALATELLNIEELGLSGKGDRESRYSRYIRWLEENQPYLYFTDESFQCSSNPAFADVDLERKYLQREPNSCERQPLVLAKEEEKGCLNSFKRLSCRKQRALSEYSQRLRSRNIQAWQKWLRLPVDEQLRAAKAGSEEEK